MDSFELEQIEKARARSGEAYLEFFRNSCLSIGLYKLHAGDLDSQEPHGEDEVYYCAAGRAIVRVAGEDRPVQSGIIVFVGAQVDHRFHTITEDLTLLVFFAPAEGSNQS